MYCFRPAKIINNNVLSRIISCSCRKKHDYNSSPNEFIRYIYNIVMMRLVNKSIWIGFLSFVFLLASCDKIADTSSTITVSDLNGNRISGAEVHVFPSPSEPSSPPAELNETLDETKVTNSDGQVFFDYTDFYKRGQVGLFVLDVEVTYQSPDSLITVLSVIKIEEQESNVKEIELPFRL